jgi:hypothetical protein
MDFKIAQAKFGNVPGFLQLQLIATLFVGCMCLDCDVELVLGVCVILIQGVQQELDVSLSFGVWKGSGR